MMSLPPPIFLGPFLLAAVALVALRTPGRRPGALPRRAEAAAGAVLAAALLSPVHLALAGPVTLGLGAGPALLALRLDAVTATMAILVAFLGWAVTRYARSSLDGEAREGAFHGLLLATLAGVLLLVLSGSLAVLVLGFWAVGLGVRRLVLFYPERPAAWRAGRKFALAWGLGDAALLAAALAFWAAFGTADLARLAAGAAMPLSPAAGLGVAFLVAAALLKTAALPLHGWLTGAIEAPTPLSALLHAGIVSAGGIALIRMAELVQASPAAMAVLVLAGGAGALLGAAVMLTQSAVKTALAWSTVAQMGFLMLQCGLGLWALALLHVVAHALYKAHAFLAAGGAVQAVAAARRAGPVAVPGPRAVALAFALAVAIYAAVAAGFGLVAGPRPPQALALGAILVFGVAYLVAQGLADAAPRALTRRTGLAALGAALAYFAFHCLAGLLWGHALPAPPPPGPAERALLLLAILSFGLVAVAQALLPRWAHHPAAAGLRVHLANGLYLDAILDRLTGGFRTGTPQT